MRRWKIAAAAAAAALLAAGCGSGSGSGGGGNAPVTLTIWHNYGTEQNATALVNLAKAFHKLHPNITVNVVSQPASNYFALLQAKAISTQRPRPRGDVDRPVHPPVQGLPAEPEGTGPGVRARPELTRTR